MAQQDRISWNGHLQAQSEADAAFSKLKDKPVRSAVPRKKKHRRSRKKTTSTPVAKTTAPLSKNDEYRKYLLSKTWKSKRKQALAHYGHRCSKCGYDKRLVVHHITYERFMKERMEDLCVLCARCHDLMHGRIRLDDDPVSEEFRLLAKSF